MVSGEGDEGGSVSDVEGLLGIDYGARSCRSARVVFGVARK